MTDETRLEEWLKGFKHAWEARDWAAFIWLFAPAATCSWAPFSETDAGPVKIVIGWGIRLLPEEETVFLYKVTMATEGLNLVSWSARPKSPEIGDVI